MKRSRSIRGTGDLIVTRRQLESVVRQIEARFVESLKLIEEHFDERLKKLEPQAPPIALVEDEPEPVINAS